MQLIPSNDQWVYLAYSDDDNRGSCISDHNNNNDDDDDNTFEA